MASRDKETTRAAIFTSAQRMFAERGYAGTPLRDIAGEVGVDPAMIIRYFSSKEELFLETMAISPENWVVLDGPLETLGDDFIDYVLNGGEEVRGIFLALMQASGSEGVSSRLKQAHEQNFVAPLLKRLHGDDADVRARLAAALVGGLLYSLWVVGDEQLLATDHTEVVRRYGHLLQQLITP